MKKKGDKLRVAVLAGGYSGEWEISLKTADFIMRHLAPAAYDPYLIRITPDQWVLVKEEAEYPVNGHDLSVDLGGETLRFDLVFIAIHGTPGEDGVLQGYCEMIGMPYTTGGPFNTSLTFNKWATSSVMRRMGLLTPNAEQFTRDAVPDTETILSRTGLPCFVKPNEGGSSLGATKVTEETELQGGIQKALSVNAHVLVEQYLEGVEVSCSVIRQKGTVVPMPLIEIVPRNAFFDYEAKYLDSATEEIVPARLPETVYRECQNIARRLYVALQCRGMVRMDFIVREFSIYVIELNTVPGLSPTSLLPQEAENMGLSFGQMLDDVVDEALGKQ